MRQAQRRRKLEKKQAREANRRGKEQAQQEQSSEEAQRRQKVEDRMGCAGADEDQLAAVAAYPDQISMDSYFGACPGGLFRDPGLPPTERSLELLMEVLQVRQLGVASASRPDHENLLVPTCLRVCMCACTTFAPSLTCTRTVQTRAPTHKRTLTRKPAHVHRRATSRPQSSTRATTSSSPARMRRCGMPRSMLAWLGRASSPSHPEVVVSASRCRSSSPFTAC